MTIEVHIADAREVLNYLRAVTENVPEIATKESSIQVHLETIEDAIASIESQIEYVSMEENKTEIEISQEFIDELKRAHDELSSPDNSPLLGDERNSLTEAANHLHQAIALLENYSNSSNSDAPSPQDLEKKIDSLVEELDRQEDSIDTKIAELERNQAQVEKQMQEVENSLVALGDARSEFENLKDEASDLIRSSLSTKLGEEFQDRKQELESTLRYWKAGSLFSILVLIGFSVWIYLDITSAEPTGTVTLSKVLLILPVSVLVWFCVTNYSRQKRLMHEYEFKKNVAVSLPGFRERVEENLPEGEEERAAELMIQTADTIYSNPQQNIAEGADPNQETPPGAASEGSVMTLLRKLNNN